MLNGRFCLWQIYIRIYGHILLAHFSWSICACACNSIWYILPIHLRFPSGLRQCSKFIHFISFRINFSPRQIMFLFSLQFASYIQMLILCYMGHNVQHAVRWPNFRLYFILWVFCSIEPIIFLFIVWIEWANLPCIERNSMVFDANKRAKRFCTFINSHAKRIAANDRTAGCTGLRNGIGRKHRSLFLYCSFLC